MLVKNQEYEVQIEDMGNDGEGIGHIDGIAVFVKDAVMGDFCRVRIIKVKKSYAYGRLMEVITPSAFRVMPKCDKARSCGGCTMQHISYEKQLEYKWNKVKNCLERIGGIQDAGAMMEPIYGMEEPFYYRNKAQFPVGTDKDGNIVMGFYAGRTHSIIPTESCVIQAKGNDTLLRLVREYMSEEGIPSYDEENHNGLVRHVLTRVGFTTGEIMVCLVINGQTLPKADKLVAKLTAVPGMISICINIKCNRF